MLTEKPPQEILDAWDSYRGGIILPPVQFESFAAGFRSGILARTRVAEKTWIEETEKARDMTAPAIQLAKLVQDMHRHPTPPGQRQDAALFCAERILRVATDSSGGGSGDGASDVSTASRTSEPIESETQQEQRA